jgi:hydroxymethylpyrimidine/phosphomethylpyrimidine kinase
VNGRVLVVAGSDSGGGAGIQADIKTVTALGGYAATAITALTAQDTQTVHGIHEVPPAFVGLQMEVVLADIGADCIKTGMLASPAILWTVVDVIARLAPDTPLVVDPVMAAKGGAALVQPETVDVIRSKLLPRATVLTPNIPEAAMLAGRPITGAKDAQDVGRELLALGPKAVLMKGGHLEGPKVVDLLITEKRAIRMESPRIPTPHTHGTGCTLASGIATGLAQGLALEAAAQRARDYLMEAIRTAPGLGTGHGPVNHGHPLAAKK